MQISPRMKQLGGALYLVLSIPTWVPQPQEFQRWGEKDVVSYALMTEQNIPTTPNGA